MINRVIIFGGHIQALGLARQAKGEGVEVILVTEDKWSVARFSNSIHKCIICKSINQINSILKPFEDSDTLLFPTSDEYVEYLTNNYTTFSRHFILGVPEPDCTTIFLNKRNTYKFCEDNNIPHPASKYPESIDDVIEIGKHTSFPLVVKPGTMYSFHKLVGKKAFLCQNAEELVSKCVEIQQKGFPIKDLIIQQFLSDGPKSLYSFGTFAQNGEPVAWIQANRIRQNPMDFGNSTTYAISCCKEEIEKSARQILHLTNYSGMAEIEFMYDSQSSEYKFLEINTRAWKWHTISNAFGFGFLSEMIRSFNGQDSQFKPSTTTKAWQERLTDYTIILKEVLKGRMSFTQAIRSMKMPKTYAVWSVSDPLPAFMYILMAPVLYFKRH